MSDAVENGQSPDTPVAVADAEEYSQEEMEAFYDSTMQNFREGEVVKGTVVEKTDDWVLVDIGYKSEGAIPINEFSAPEEVNVGDSFDVYIEAPEDEEGMPLLSKVKADRIKNWANIQEVYEQDGVIEGRVVRRVKGGLKIDIGIDAFMPASQLSWRPVGDLEKFIGQSMEVKIIKLTKRRRNVVVSRRKLIEEQRADEKKHLLDTIHEGQIIQGEVKNITDFGAFVDVGGIDGLLHVTDMSWGRVKHPSQAVSVGDKINVKVLNFDPQTERISLGLKQTTENPWTTAQIRYPVGTVVRGTVVSMTDYGAFVQLEEGIEGMVHVSEMSWTRRVRHPNELFEIGDEVDVMVLSVDAENEKIALGIKQTKPNPWAQISERYPVNSTVKGVVRNLTEYGAFVQLEEGIDGLLHVSDMSWTQKVTHPSEMLEKGQEVEVKILSIDPENEKISVGLKQMENDPWLEVVEQTPIGSHVEVEVAKLVSFGAFAKLDNGVEGLIHVSEISDDRVQKPEEVLSIGDKVTAKVISVDPVERKIGLSVREYKKDIESKTTEDYGKSGEESQVSVGEAIGDALPKSMLSAGSTLADAANELMASVSSGAANSKPAQKSPAAEAPAEESAPAQESQPAEEEASPVEPASPDESASPQKSTSEGESEEPAGEEPEKES